MRKVLLFSSFMVLIGCSNSASISESEKDKIVRQLSFREHLKYPDDRVCNMIVKSKDSLYLEYCLGELSTDNKEKIKHFSNFISQNQIYGVPESYFNRGLVYYQEENLNAAKNDLLNAISLGDSTFYPYYFLGATFSDLKDYENARMLFTKAIKLNHSKSGYLAYQMRGNALLRLDQSELAIKDYTESLKIQPDNPPVYMVLVSIYYDSKNYDLSKINLEKLKQYDKKNKYAEFISKYEAKLNQI